MPIARPSPDQTKPPVAHAASEPHYTRASASCDPSRKRVWPSQAFILLDSLRESSSSVLQRSRARLECRCYGYPMPPNSSDQTCRMPLALPYRAALALPNAVHDRLAGLPLRAKSWSGMWNGSPFTATRAAFVPCASRPAATGIWSRPWVTRRWSQPESRSPPPANGPMTATTAFSSGQGFSRHPSPHP